MDEGQENPLLEQALKVGAPTDESVDTTATAEPSRAPEPAVGSYEGFMSSFGAPARWAGR